MSPVLPCPIVIQDGPPPQVIVIIRCVSFPHNQCVRVGRLCKGVEQEGAEGQSALSHREFGAQERSDFCTAWEPSSRAAAGQSCRAFARCHRSRKKGEKRAKLTTHSAEVTQQSNTTCVTQTLRLLLLALFYYYYRHSTTVLGL